MVVDLDGSQAIDMHSIVHHSVRVCVSNMSRSKACHLIINMDQLGNAKKLISLSCSETMR
jgi:hypothetical protein